MPNNRLADCCCLFGEELYPQNHWRWLFGPTLPSCHQKPEEFSGSAVAGFQSWLLQQEPLPGEQYKSTNQCMNHQCTPDIKCLYLDWWWWQLIIGRAWKTPQRATRTKHLVTMVVVHLQRIKNTSVQDGGYKLDTSQNKIRWRQIFPTTQITFALLPASLGKTGGSGLVSSRYSIIGNCNIQQYSVSVSLSTKMFNNCNIQWYSVNASLSTTKN